MARYMPLVAVLAILVISVPSISAAAATELGSIKLPKTIDYAGKTIEAGRYTVSLGESKEGPTLVLSTKDGEQLLEELAIVQTKDKSVRRARVGTVVDSRDEQLVRLTVRQDNMRYVAYFEIKP